MKERVLGLWGSLEPLVVVRGLDQGQAVAVMLLPWFVLVLVLVLVLGA